MKAIAKYTGELFAIAAPMFIGNLGHVLTGATDVFVAARHSVDTLASIAGAMAEAFYGIPVLIMAEGKSFIPEDMQKVLYRNQQSYLILQCLNHRIQLCQHKSYQHRNQHQQHQLMRYSSS